MSGMKHIRLFRRIKMSIDERSVLGNKMPTEMNSSLLNAKFLQSTNVLEKKKKNPT